MICLVLEHAIGSLYRLELALSQKGMPLLRCHLFSDHVVHSILFSAEFDEFVNFIFELLDPCLLLFGLLITILTVDPRLFKHLDMLSVPAEKLLEACFCLHAK